MWRRSCAEHEWDIGISGYPTHNIEQRKMSAKILLWQRLIKHIDQEIKNGIA